ncbi:hypothetical protein [Actinokineospora enzanensis]|uniref:hypothetical protein n=1 Tax=Actinokineospora enzanensis TaxID=155975 RepID=UPI00035FBFB6|nr:hypothetical protein [Actinokineospora enzanensis]
MQRAVAELERYVAGQAPAVPDVVPVDVPTDTRRVRELRAEVDEARALLELQADAAPLLLDTDRVRRSRKRAAEAVRLPAPGRRRGCAWRLPSWRWWRWSVRWAGRPRACTTP